MRAPDGTESALGGSVDAGGRAPSQAGLAGRRGEPFSSRARLVTSAASCSSYLLPTSPMPRRPKVTRPDAAAEEPMGIVISNGGTPEPSPRFSAFVWGPAPEVSDEPREVKVA